jgi:hypothetical protein
LQVIVLSCDPASYAGFADQIVELPPPGGAAEGLPGDGDRSISAGGAAAPAPT